MYIDSDPPKYFAIAIVLVFTMDHDRLWIFITLSPSEKEGIPLRVICLRDAMSCLRLNYATEILHSIVFLVLLHFFALYLLRLNEEQIRIKNVH